MALPKVYVDVGFTASGTSNVFTVGDPTLGQVGVVPIGDPNIWVDVTPYVRSWSVKRGASKDDDPTLRYDPSTCTIELNDGDRRFDPDNLAGPYVSAGVSQIEANRRVRIRAVWNGTTYPLFYGYADDWVPEYQGNNWTYTTLTATDASKLFAAHDRTAVAPIGGGQHSGSRIVTILDDYGWPSSNRSVATGDTTLQPTDLGGNMLAELQLVQDTEQGSFWISAAGTPTFGNRKEVLTYAPSKTSQATFGDGGYAATGEIPYADVVMSTPADTLVNSINATMVGGTTQHVEDATSVSRYGPKSLARDDLIMETDAAALQWAQWLLYQFETPERRFSRINFNRPSPAVESAFWPACLNRDLGHRITVKRRPAGGGSTIQHDCFIRGIEHSSDGADWKCTFTLQSADRFSFFVVGDPILGRVGYNAVAY